MLQLYRPLSARLSALNRVASDEQEGDRVPWGVKPLTFRERFVEDGKAGALTRLPRNCRRHERRHKSQKVRSFNRHVVCMVDAPSHVIFQSRERSLFSSPSIERSFRFSQASIGT